MLKNSVALVWAIATSKSEQLKMWISSSPVTIAIAHTKLYKNENWDYIFQKYLLISLHLLHWPTCTSQVVDR
jgi:hypothetical protein